MTGSIAAGIVAIVVGLIAFFLRKAGKDAAQNAANKETLRDVVKANAPPTPIELDMVRQKYRRD